VPAPPTTSARTRALEAESRTRETRDAVERDVARLPDAAGQLRQRWSRIDGCGAWRPILVSRTSTLTDGTARQILAHNETDARLCDW